MKRTRRQADGEEKEAGRGGDGGTKWMARCSSEILKKRKKSKQRELKGGNLDWKRTKRAAIWSDRRKQRDFFLKRNAEQRRHQESGNESHVAGPAKHTSSLRCGVMKAVRLHVLPAFGPGPRALWAGQVVPARPAVANHNRTERALQHGGKQESVQQDPSCFFVPQRCCPCC